MVEQIQIDLPKIEFTQKQLDFAKALAKTPRTDPDYVALQLLPWILNKSIKVVLLGKYGDDSIEFERPGVPEIELIYKFSQFMVLYPLETGKHVESMTRQIATAVDKETCSNCSQITDCLLISTPVCKPCIEAHISQEMKNRVSSFVKNKFMFRECLEISRLLP